MAFFNELVAQGGEWAGGNAYVLSGNNDTIFSSSATTQATATPLTASNATITAAVANGAFILPNDAGIATVFNNSAVAAVIFPAVGFSINNGAANAGFTIPAGKSAIFFTALISTASYGNWAAILSA